MSDGKFYTTKGPLGFCSNFYRATIHLDGQDWMTTEHYYQAQKSSDPNVKEAIRLAPNPKEAARIGRSIALIPNWDNVKYEVMYRAVQAKFNQHPDLAQKLAETGTIELIEDTIGSARPDAVWGNGSRGEGKNALGKILMTIRDDFDYE